MAKDESTGAILAYDCEARRPSDVWVMKQLARDFEAWGRRDAEGGKLEEWCCGCFDEAGGVRLEFEFVASSCSCVL